MCKPCGGSVRGVGSIWNYNIAFIWYKNRVKTQKSAVLDSDWYIVCFLLTAYMLIWCDFISDHTIHITTKGTLTRGQSVIRGHFLWSMSYLPHVKEHILKGHLSCRDTFSWMLRVPWRQVLLYTIMTILIYSTPYIHYNNMAKTCHY